MTDQPYIQTTSQKDTQTFDRIVREHLPLVYGYLTRFTGDSSLAEDLAQETFVRAWRHANSFDPSKPFKAWLMRIAHNVAVDTLRHKRVRLFSELSKTELARIEKALDPAASPDYRAQRAETKAAVAAALGKLKPDYKEVLLLHYREELTTSEIAHMLSLPLETVRSRLRRARHAFRRQFEPTLVSSSVLDRKDTYDQTRAQGTSQLTPSPSGS